MHLFGSRHNRPEIGHSHLYTIKELPVVRKDYVEWKFPSMQMNSAQTN